MAAGAASTLFAAAARRRRRSVALLCTQARNGDRGRRRSLLSMLPPKGSKPGRIVPKIERWSQQHAGGIKPVELRNFVCELRRRKCFTQALELSEWMNARDYTFTASDHAIMLDLICQVRGLEAAEAYFTKLRKKDRTEKVYGMLLYCYVRGRSVDKCLSHMEEMKELGYATSALPYNNIMNVYAHTGQHDKIPSVLTDMKSNGITPDKYSYGLCIDSYRSKLDIAGVENLLEEMEAQENVTIDWNTYAVVASICIKADQREKAVFYLQKSEEKMDKTEGAGYNFIIPLYGQLGSKLDIHRLWELRRAHCKVAMNTSYSVMISTLVKMGELQEAEMILKEWASNLDILDFRVANVLLYGYRHADLLDKAAQLLDGLAEEGKAVPSSSWGIVANGYSKEGNAEKAHKYMKKALGVYAPNAGWKPLPVAIRIILDHLSNKGSTEDRKSFMSLLKIAMPQFEDMQKVQIDTAEGADSESTQ